MLKIHNNNFKKYRIPLISAFVMIGGMFLFSYLTYIPTRTFAAEETETRTLSDINYMQEMNTKICENTTVGNTKRLEDTRDGKLYWVAKFKDGNCWMTQNLDFDIPGVLLPDDTDVNSEITISAVKFTNENGVGAWRIDVGENNIDYYDPGKMLKVDPASRRYCGASSSTEKTTKLNDSVCIDNGWLDVGDERRYKPKDTAPQNDNPFDTSNAAKVLENNVYDAHYLSGNYYSWSAATANSSWNATTRGQQAAGSICPKGWKLPTSGQNLSQYPTLSAGSLDSYDVYGSFAYLFRQYGLATSSSAGNVTANGYNVYDAPLYYLFTGRIYYGSTTNSGWIGYAGSGSSYWSSTVAGDTQAYSFYFHDTESDSNRFYPSLAVDRYFGYPVRCVNNSTITTSENLSGPTVEPDSNQANVAITVSPVISIDATSGMSESIDFTQVAEGNITAKVSSNQTYQVLLSTEQSNLEQNPVLANFNIPMVSNDTEITAGVNSWGVKKTLSVAAGGTAGDDTILTNTLYSPIGIGDDKVLFYKSSGAESKTLVFPVAISVDATLPSGIYSTQVTITAVAN